MSLVSGATAQEWRVPMQQDGARLDHFLTICYPSWSRRELVELIAGGHARLNGRSVKKSVPVRAGDIVTTLLTAALLPNGTLPITVVHADDTLVVLDKPTGIPSVALRHHETATVANFLATHYPDTLTASPRGLEAGLVHRLDTPTSGLLVAARTRVAYTALRQQFRAHTVEKQYLALVEGHLRVSGQIVSSLEPTGPGGRHLRVRLHPQGEPHAVTTYTPLTVFADYTLMRVTLVTGLRHQIRAHFASGGYPIVGDSQYGAHGQAQRLYLHAERLAFTHPTTNTRVHFTSPTTREFVALAEQWVGEKEREIRPEKEPR